MTISPPEEQGVDSVRLADFVQRFFALEFTHGLVVVRHGKIVAECYRDPCGPADRHQLFSLSKSFTSTAVGIALGEGLLPSLDAPLVSFFPEFLSPRVSDRMRRVTLHHLLVMGMGRASCGLWGDRYAALHAAFEASDAARDMKAVAERFAHGTEFFDNDRPWVENLLEDELRDEPGSRFEYNTAATFLLSAVLQKVSGVRLIDYLRPRFLRPLGIADDATWDRTPDGIDLGGAGLNLTVREIAAAAQCWMRGGVAPDGRRLIPASYMAEATSKQIDNDGPGRNPDWCQGYGYQFWRCQHGLFRGDGASGQFAIAMPQFDAVAVGTAGVVNMQREFDVVWESLLPAFASGPLQPNPKGLARLRETERSQKFDLGPDGAPDPALPADGTPVCFDCAPNPLGLVSVSLCQDPGGVAIDFVFGDGLSDTLYAGYRSTAKSLLRRIAAGHAFTAFARASWPAPGRLRTVAAVPCTTAFYTIDFDFSAATMHEKTPIWFAHPWLSDVTVSLVPRCAEKNRSAR